MPVSRFAGSEAFCAEPNVSSAQMVQNRVLKARICCPLKKRKVLNSTSWSSTQVQCTLPATHDREARQQAVAGPGVEMYKVEHLALCSPAAPWV